MKEENDGSISLSVASNRGVRRHSSSSYVTAPVIRSPQTSPKQVECINLDESDLFVGVDGTRLDEQQHDSGMDDEPSSVLMDSDEQFKSPSPAALEKMVTFKRSKKKFSYNTFVVFILCFVNLLNYIDRYTLAGIFSLFTIKIIGSIIGSILFGLCWRSMNPDRWIHFVLILFCLIFFCE